MNSQSGSKDNLWSWSNCRDRIIRLSGRLGFPDSPELRFLGLTLSLADGRIRDNISDSHVPLAAGRASRLYQFVYYVLSAYSEAEPIAVQGDMITPKQMRGGRFTNRYNERTRRRIVEIFGSLGRGEFLSASAALIGGSEISFPYGDISVRIAPLPLVPITFVVSSGDSEFPAEAQIFYDSSIDHYLDMEQTNFLTNLTVDRMASAFRKLSQ